MNAKKELINMFKEIGKNIEDVVAINIARLNDDYEFDTVLKTSSLKEEDLDKLNFDYDDGFGVQELDGVVLFKDNTWLSREEYDGSECWGYNKPPTVDEILNSGNS